MEISNAEIGGNDFVLIEEPKLALMRGVKIEEIPTRVGFFTIFITQNANFFKLF